MRHITPLLIAGLFAAGAASAASTRVTVTPPGGARFLSGQRFDIRVEGKGVGPFSATLAVDGVPRAFTSGTQDSVDTDGLSAPGWGGFNLRGFSIERAGKHTLSATFRDATDAAPVAVSAVIEVVGVRSGRDRDNGGRTKNVIVLLGDGMGVAHRTAGRLVRHGVTAGDPNGFLAMDFHGTGGTGFVTTHSLNSIVTDSAPGMACYTTGNHAQNGQEGVYPANMTSPFFFPRVEYMSEYLHRVKGTSTGIVSTADVEDATPAANAVHTGNRNAGQGIVDQYLDESGNTGLAVLMGGGRRWFLPASQFGSSRSTGNDYGPVPADLAAAWNIAKQGAIDPDRNLVSEFRGAGFSYVETGAELQSAGAPEKLLGLFGYGNMNVAVDKIAKRRGKPVAGGAGFVVDDYHAPYQPMLDEMTEAALRVLSRNPRGFFLMVEGAHIDKQSHLMDAERTVGEVIEFDNAVAVAKSWADKLGDTVVIVLADHECSGFSIIGALAGGVKSLQGLPSDAKVVDPATQPARQKLVGVFDAAGSRSTTSSPTGIRRRSTSTARS
jgi:alkaline phosphatase